MQTLLRAVTNEDGIEETRSIRLVRIWQDVSGLQVGLTPAGDYITLDGEIVINPSLFEIMPIEEKSKALDWFESQKNRIEAGLKAKSSQARLKMEIPKETNESDFVQVFRESMDAMRTQQAEFLATVTAAVGADVKAPQFKALYARRKGNQMNWSQPHYWDEPVYEFKDEPDWWGGVQSIVVPDPRGGADYTYERYLVPADDVAGIQNRKKMAESEASATRPVGRPRKDTGSPSEKKMAFVPINQRTKKQETANGQNGSEEL